MLELYYQRKRDLLSILKAQYGANDVSESFVRAEAAISQTATKIDFRVMANQSSDLVVENKIDLNDTFVGFALGFALLKRQTAYPGKEKLNFFPDVEVFGTNDTATLESLYGGKFSVKFGNKQLIETLSMQNFLKVPAIQKHTALGLKSDNTTATAGAGSGTGFVGMETGIARNQFNLLENYHILSQHLILPGQENIEASIVYPAMDQTNALTPGSGYTYRIAMLMDGFIIKNTR